MRVTYKDAPDRGNQARSFNGTIGWVTTPRALLGEYQVEGTELDGLHFDAELAFPGQLKQALTNLSVGYPDTIDGHDVEVVQGHGPRNLLVTLYFDKQSGLLVREIRFGRTPIGRVPSQVDYSDYRAVDGIKFPFQYKFSWLDGRDNYQLTDVKVNVPIDETRFGKPSMDRSSRSRFVAGAVSVPRRRPLRRAAARTAPAISQSAHSPAPQALATHDHRLLQRIPPRQNRMRHYVGEHHPGRVRRKLKAVLRAVLLVLAIELQIIMKPQHEPVICRPLRFHPAKRAQHPVCERPLGMLRHPTVPRPSHSAAPACPLDPMLSTPSAWSGEYW